CARYDDYDVSWFAYW
nr:immunoglobulin heavy chain junction region [Mus musculus]